MIKHNKNFTKGTEVAERERERERERALFFKY